MKGICLFILLLYSGHTCCQLQDRVRSRVVWLTPDSNHSSKQLFYENTGSVLRSYPGIGSLNFNPVFNFSGNNEQIALPIRANNLAQATVFVVYRETEDHIEQNVWDLSSDLESLSLTTKKVSGVTGDIPYNTAQPGSAVIHTYTRNWRTSNSGDIDGLVLGNNNKGTSSFRGQIAEYILFDKVLNQTIQTKIETYLALKYGITLRHDYISSSGKSIWLYKNNSVYNHRIIGIGRDYQLNLNQTQSEIKERNFYMAFGAGEIRNSNKENNYPIDDHDFLILGDNDGELILDDLNGKNAPIFWMKRQWLLRVSGHSADKIQTEIKINISKIAPPNQSPGNYFLGIDRSGSGNFSSEKIDYIQASEITRDGIITFRNVFWDIDGSGKDLFSFGFCPGNNLKLEGNSSLHGDDEISLYPNPSAKGDFTLMIHHKNPTSVQVTIFDESGRQVQSFSGGKQIHYLFKGKLPGSSGIYNFQITTPYKKTTRQFVVQ